MKKVLAILFVVAVMFAGFAAVDSATPMRGACPGADIAPCGQ